MRTVLSSWVEGDFAAFDTMDRDKCIETWRKRFGREPPKYVSVQFMRRALVYEAQVKAQGGLSPAVRTALERSMNDVRKSNGKAGSGPPVPSQLLRPGTQLFREWNGRSYQVEVLDNGFRMDGKTYRSLTATARKITGAHWSGPRFFGVG